MKRPTRWIPRTLAAAAAGVTLLAVASAAVTCRPSWYRPPAIDYARFDSDRAALSAVESSVSASLHGLRPAEIELHEEQVNRWLAARRELWIDCPWEEPPGLEAPFVAFSPDGIRVAVTVARGGLRAVASCRITLRVQPDGVYLRWAAARLGALPVPRGFLRTLADELLPGSDALSRLAAEGETRLENDWPWPNGRIRVRATSVTLGEGVLRIRVEPL